MRLKSQLHKAKLNVVQPTRDDDDVMLQALIYCIKLIWLSGVTFTAGNLIFSLHSTKLLQDHQNVFPGSP